MESRALVVARGSSYSFCSSCNNGFDSGVNSLLSPEASHSRENQVEIRGTEGNQRKYYLEDTTRGFIRWIFNVWFIEVRLDRYEQTGPRESFVFEEHCRHWKVL